MSGLRSLLLGGVGGAGGVVIARILLPDLSTHQGKTGNKTTESRAEPQQLVSEPQVPSSTASIPSLSTSKASTTSLSSSATTILKYGVPSPGIPTILEYENHVLEYDPVRRGPKWVAEHVSKPKAFGEIANRKLSRFDRDPNIPPQFTADNTDFWGSGWSRGHMAPAGNNKHSQSAMNQTFYLSNIVPQDLDNNGNYWNRLEIYCRELTKQFQDVYIISGPLWLPEQENTADKSIKADQPHQPNETKGTSEETTILQAANKTIIEKPIPLANVDNQISTPVEVPVSSDNKPVNTTAEVVQKPTAGGRKFRPKPPKKFIKYQVLGTNNVAVPTHLFKIILIEDPRLERPLLSSFIIPNRPVQDVHLKDFEVELAEVENHVGVRFHQQLDLGSVDRLCLKEGCQMRDYKLFQDFFWTRRMSSPWSLRNLEADWKEVCSRGLNTAAMEELYLAKKNEFLSKQTPKGDGVNEAGETKPKSQQVESADKIKDSLKVQSSESGTKPAVAA